ncbi:MAG: ABC transporter substrate-binding protein [Thermodesulfovibrionales bacterium]
MKKYRLSASIIFIILILVSIFSFTDCNRQPQKEKEKAILKIGVILPLTGPLNYRGQEEKKAMELAMQDFNQKHADASITLIFKDSNSRSLEAITDNLINTERVSAFMASTAPVSRAISYIANNKKIIMGFLTSDSTIQKLSPYIFRLSMSQEAEAYQIASYFAGENKAEQIVVLFANQPQISRQITDYLIPKFTQSNINISFYEPYASWQINFKETVERIEHSRATSLLILGFKEEYGPILEELARRKLTGRIKIVSGINLLSLENLSSELFEGTIIAAPQYVFDKNERAKAFEQRFLNVCGHTPGLEAAFAYDAVSVLSEGLVDGLVSGHGNAETVSFKTTNRKYEGVMGDIAIDNEGGLSVPMGMGVIKKGKIVPLSNTEKH